MKSSRIGQKVGRRGGQQIGWLVGVAIACLWLTGCQFATAPQGITAQVSTIVSAQELEVVGSAAYPEITERVRLEGIAVPDRTQRPWSDAARAKLEQLIANQTLLLETDAEPRDARGRRLAYVWRNGKLLNEVLVAEGYAIAQPHPPNDKYRQRLSDAQDRARLLGLGIWNPQQPLRQIANES